MKCPRCSQPLDFIETGESNDEEIKDIYTCHNAACATTFVYEFRDRPTDQATLLRGGKSACEFWTVDGINHTACGYCDECEATFLPSEGAA